MPDLSRDAPASETGALYRNKLRDLAGALTQTESHFKIRDLLAHRSLRSYLAPAKKALLGALIASDAYVRIPAQGGSLPTGSGPASPLPQGVSERDSVTTRQIWEREWEIITIARTLAARDSRPVGVDLSAVVDRVAREKTLNPEQDAALRASVLSGDFTWIAGRAGAGKTHTAGAIRQVIADSEAHLPEAERSVVIGSALTHSVRLNFTSVDFPEDETATIARLKTSGTPSGRRHVLLVDETGVVSTEDLVQLMRLAQDAHCKVVLIGDEKQFSPIGHGGMFEAVQIALPGCGAELATVQRQHDPEHRRAIEAIGRATSQEERRAAFADFLAVLSRPASGQDSAWPSGIENHHGSQDAIAAIERNWRRRLESDPAAQARDKNGPRSVALASRNVVVEEICDRIHDVWRSYEARQGRHRPEYLITTRRPAGEGERAAIVRSKFSPGEGIVFRKNAAGVTNGSTGLITDIRPVRDSETGAVLDHELWVTLDYDGRSVRFTTRQYDHFQHDTAITLYRSQGRTYDTVEAVVDGEVGAERGLVELSRHRRSLTLHVAEPDLHDPAVFAERLSVSRAKTAAVTPFLRQQREQEEREAMMDIDPPAPSSGMDRAAIMQWRRGVTADDGMDLDVVPENDSGQALARDERAAGAAAEVQPAPDPSMPVPIVIDVDDSESEYGFSPSMIAAMDHIPALSGGAGPAADHGRSTQTGAVREAATHRMPADQDSDGGSDVVSISASEWREAVARRSTGSIPGSLPERAIAAQGRDVNTQAGLASPGLLRPGPDSVAAASMSARDLRDAGSVAQGEPNRKRKRSPEPEDRGGADQGLPAKRFRSAIRADAADALARAMLRGDAETVTTLVDEIRRGPDRSRLPLLEARGDGKVPVLARALRNANSLRAVEAYAGAIHAMSNEELSQTEKVGLIEARRDDGLTGMTHALESTRKDMVLLYASLVEPLPREAQLKLIEGQDEEGTPALVRALKMGRSEPLENYCTAIALRPPEERLRLLAVTDANGCSALSHALATGNADLVRAHMQTLGSLPSELVCSPQGLAFLKATYRGRPAFANALRVGHTDAAVAYCEGLVSMLPPARYVPLIEARNDNGTPILAQALEQGRESVLRGFQRIIPLIPDRLHRHLLEARTFPPALRPGPAGRLGTGQEEAGLQQRLEATGKLLGTPGLSRAIERGQPDMVAAYAKLIRTRPLDEQKSILRAWENGDQSGLVRAARDGLAQQHVQPIRLLQQSFIPDAKKVAREKIKEVSYQLHRERNPGRVR